MALQFTAKTFENFILDLENLLLEDSTLSKTGMPKKMITAIYQKQGHYSEEYPRMAHTYRSTVAIPMPYKYYSPEHDIEIPEPIVATGRKTNTDPYSGRAIGSQYTDFHWFIESLPYGPNRALVANPDLDFYMYIYDKSKSKGATGMQYAILWWDPEKKQAVDFGYSELTTREVDLRNIRTVHDTKGGNTSMKVQEFVRSATRQGDKAYAPSPSKPLYMYKLAAETSAATGKRGERREKQQPVTSMSVIDLFARKYSSILPKLKPNLLKKMTDEIDTDEAGMRKVSVARSDISASGSQVIPDSVKVLAKNLGVDDGSLVAYLFTKFRDFRQEVFEASRLRMEGEKSAYAKTSGFDLEAENKIATKLIGHSYWRIMYSVEKQQYSPDEERKDAETAYREAQPEKYKRSLPMPGNYASIQSMIKKHKLDGTLNRFLWFLATGKVASIEKADISVASLLGVSAPKAPEKPTLSGEEEESEDNWLY